jgi:hypothetical protein
MVNFDTIKNEKALRTLIKRNLNKEYHASTKCSIDFIYSNLEDAYASGMNYDVTDMQNAIFGFAANSTNQADYCIKLVNKMRFKSEEPSVPMIADNDELVFYDVEVFPNLFLVNWKVQGEGKNVVRMINPTPTEIEGLIRYNLVGFNCRRYDNHILYGRLMGYDNEQLYKLSQRLINKDKTVSQRAMFSEAYNISYTDVYDFSKDKKSLKKWEIELGIHHQELGLPWDKPVPEELWTKVAEYCDNDVIATEAVFNYLQSDFVARLILSDMANMTPNDTTNSLTTQIVFGRNRKPQGQFHYRNLAEPYYEMDEELYEFLNDACPDMINHTHGDAGSFLPYFPGYTYEAGKSIYRGEEVGEGGYVYAEPGIYTNVALLDIASMHPSSIVAECHFGPQYTRRFKDILDARLAIKHKDFEKARTMLGGVLAGYLTDESSASNLAGALKIAINSVYGLTAASFDHPFRDPRNKDNIVAKRGALFMIDLKHEVQKRGYTVVHIKTDSIKIANATPDIIQFVMDFGKSYGYTFEHEETYDRICLVNDAVYIAKYKEPHIDKATGKEIWWTATGTQFQVPYVFKKLFSRESIEFDDMCETKAVTSALYLDMNENLPDVSEWETVKAVREKTGKLTKKEESILAHYADISDEELDERIAVGHSYHFVGKVGQFCPIKPGCNGAMLCREGTDKNGNLKYSAATGSKGYRWLESEMVAELGKEGDIDRRYYDDLVNDAVDAISEYGDFEWFVSDNGPIDCPIECSKRGTEACLNCPYEYGDEMHIDCKINQLNE